MTFSIVARSADGASWGVAVASKYLAAASAVIAARAGVGALATQAWCNLAYRPWGLAALDEGLDAQACIDRLTGRDPGRAVRQLGVVGASGPGASYTGPDCMDWAGGLAGLSDAGEAYAIQGNILTGPEVVDSMRTAWLAGDPAADLADRLVAALSAGDVAGGDRRGRQCAGVLVVSDAAREVARTEFGSDDGPDVDVDLRVDDHPEPVTELTRLLGLHHLYHGRTAEELLLPLSDELATEVDALLRRLGHDTQPSGLVAWAGMHNFEGRLRAGRIDPVILDHLRTAAAAAES